MGAQQLKSPGSFYFKRRLRGSGFNVQGCLAQSFKNSGFPVQGKNLKFAGFRPAAGLTPLSVLNFEPRTLNL
jgi:hypothetical protein